MLNNLKEVTKQMNPGTKEHFTRNYRVMLLFIHYLFRKRVVANQLSKKTGEHRKQVWVGKEATSQAYQKIVEEYPHLKHAWILNSIPNEGTHQVTFTVLHGEINPYSVKVVSADDDVLDSL